MAQVEEYWEVFGGSVSDTMDIFLRLFVLKSGVLSKSKAVKWPIVRTKALPLSQEMLDSKVQLARRRLLEVEAQLQQELQSAAPDDQDDDGDNNDIDDGGHGVIQPA